MNTLATPLATLTLFFFSLKINAQEQRGFNQNASRSNHTRLAPAAFSFSPVFSTPLNGKNDSLLFRGSGGGIKFGGDYFFGKTGIGFSSGFGSSSPDNTKINSFLQKNSIPMDQLIITRSNQQNMYLLLGPAVRFGNTVEMMLHAKGGMFINNGGLINIQQKGTSRTLYRNELTGKSFYPGFQTGMNVQYKTKSDVWSFGFGADYLGTKTEVKNYDARRNGGIEGLNLSKNISDLVAGITIRYTIHAPRDHASGMATRRVLPTVNKRDAQTGMATGRRVLPTVNKKEIAIDEPGVHKMSSKSCGPVTIKTTNPDGSSTESNFSCPDDALNYARQIDSKKQKQWLPANFRTVSNTQNSKGVISGIVEWGSSSASPAFSIITNTTRGGSVSMNSQTSSTRQTQQASFGTMVRLSAREAGSGMATGKRAREAGSGMATGRRQYQPVFMENSGEICNPCMITAHFASVNSNPLYTGSGQSGDNPLYQGKQKNTDSGCNGVSGLSVLLLDAETGNVVASTKTEACGNFWFAHVPKGNYVINIKGEKTIEKTYDLSIDKNKFDIEGSVMFADDWAATTISTSDSIMPQQKAGISTSRSNIRSQKTALLNADTDGDGVHDEIWSPRSNTSLFRVATGDVDGDGFADLVAGNSFDGGANLLPGDPIPGIDVKLKKTNEETNIPVNEDGKFIISSLKQGNYQLVVTHTIYIDDKMLIDVTSGPADNIVTSESNLKGDKIVTTPNTQTQKAQNNNTVKSNRGEFAMSVIDADLDGDGNFESSFLSVNGEVAYISITETGKAKVIEKATPGIKQTMQTQVRMGNTSSSATPVKWTAPEVLSHRVWGDPHVNEKDGSLKTGEANSGSIYKDKWKSTDVFVKAIRCLDGTCRVITANEKDYPETSTILLRNITGLTAINNAAVWFEDDKGSLYKTVTDANGGVNLHGLPAGRGLKMKVNIGAEGNDDIIIKFDNSGGVYLMKAKHDIAMNAIRNLKG